MSLDGSFVDHDALRILLFLGMAIWFSFKRPGNGIKLDNFLWSLFFYFLFVWTMYDHFRPLRGWLPALYR